MTKTDFMKEAIRLGKESAENGWGGPFGAVIVKDNIIIARGQNRVLLTGDITAHAEMEAIRAAGKSLNPYAPSIAENKNDEFTLELIDRPEGCCDPVPKRSKMLMGCELYASGTPCPMCMSAIYWARIDILYYCCSLEDARKIGFDDAFQYEDFMLPLNERRIKIKQIKPANALEAYNAWMAKKDKHYY